MSEQPKFHDQAVEGVPRDASSVVLLRDAAGGGLEVFMLRRAGSSTVMHDAYVFPGGKVDDSDASAAERERYKVSGDVVARLGEPALTPAKAGALYVAACRETAEEAAVDLIADSLLPLSRWITPKVPAMMRRRFDTRFFVAQLPDGVTPVHDGQEADASAWFSPRSALEHYRDGEIMLAPPQIMTLAGLAGYSNYAALASELDGQIPKLVEPLGVKQGEGRKIVYPGHADHPVSEPAIKGPRCLITVNGRFEPEAGFEAFFA